MAFDNKRRGGMRRKKVCQFCADKNKSIDYKDVDTLKARNIAALAMRATSA